ncbi:MAG TPA: penicillin acylase family protein [Roseiflexaceae bacterium]|nr:penicillin acylase family protein [Roseiflexaceae bacterium]
MRLLRILRWILLILLILVLLVGGGGYLWLRGALPQTAGTITVNGISGPVEVLRDTDDVPHIRANSEADALFGLGYVHAQDRLWQMEFQRRIGNGRLSEILGDATLQTDKFLRTLGVARAARSAWASTDPATQALVNAYVAGINAFISTHHGRELPVEFTILGFAPEPWQPEDVLVWAKMMAWDLGGNWSSELLREQLIAKLGADKTAQLMPPYPADGPIILPQSATASTTKDEGRRTKAAARSIPSFVVRPSSPANDTYDQLLAINTFIQTNLGLSGKAIGSNNWVIGGGRTTTGKPILANDPHLGAQIPSIWYLAHVTGGKLDVIGATIPGLPAVLIGHNKRIAWGVTNTGPDVQDLYIEHVNDRNQAEFKGAWEPMHVAQEAIKVKGQPDTTIQVRRTRHGPLISDVLKDAKEPLAFRWTALDDNDTTIAAYLKINAALEWFDFSQALELYKAPMQNFVFADFKNNIGYYAPGALPIRAKGDGTLPVPGWTGEYEWTSYVPFKELPHAYNPEEGFIVSANNKAVSDSYPHFISSDWAAPYRAERIVELIKSKPKLSIDDVAAMQADVQSAQAREILPYLLHAKANGEREQAAITMLRGWDGTISADSAAATVFEAWYQQIPPHVFADELGDELWNSYRGDKDFIATALRNTLQGTGAWCDNAHTPVVEDCATTLGAALTAGLAQMSQAQGSGDITAWRWDHVHRAIFPHEPFDKVAALKPIFSRSIPNGGDGFTVNVAPVEQDDLYNQSHVPSYRQIIDLKDWGNSRFMHTVGQSGHILSGYYSNLLERWQRVEYMPMRFDKDALNAAARNRLVLKPK